MRQKMDGRWILSSGNNVSLIILYALLLVVNVADGLKITINSGILEGLLLLLFVPICYSLLRVNVITDGKKRGESTVDYELSVSPHAVLSGILICDSNGRIIDMNHSAGGILGITLEQALTMDVRDERFGVVDHKGRRIREDELPVPMAIRTGKPVRHSIVGTINLFTKELIWLDVSVNPVLDEDGSVKIIVSAFNDVTQFINVEKKLNARNEQLRHLSYTDCTMNIPNRRFFHSYLIQAWSESRKSGTPLTLFLIDIDYIREYKMAHGHSKGSEVLQKVVEAVHNVIDKEGLLARLEGELFAVLNPGLFGRQINHMEARLHHIVEEALQSNLIKEEIKDFAVLMGSSSIVPLDDDSWENLIEEAEEDLNRKKKKYVKRMLLN